MFLRITLILVSVVFVFTFRVSAQTYLQSYQIEKLSFQYRTNNSSDSRCLKWFPLSSSKVPSLEYTKQGEPFLIVELKARIDGDCYVSFDPANLVVAQSEGNRPDLRIYKIKTTPPVTVLTVEGPGFKDDLVIEAPVKKFEDVGFFSYFAKSQVYFETRYSKLTTNNPDFGGSFSAPMLPIGGGYLAIPIPLLKNFYVGLSMFQNLSNLAPAAAVPVQYSEIAFDLRYNWTGSEASGRPSFALVADYRGRNIYQTLSSDTDPKPFLISSFALPGFGVDASWYFGILLAKWDSWASRFGIGFNTHQYLFGNVEDRSIKAAIYGATLNYRIDKKWALGLGYSFTSQSMSAPEFDPVLTTIQERYNNFYLRLSLVPFIESGRGLL